MKSHTSQNYFMNKRLYKKIEKLCRKIIKKYSDCLKGIFFIDIKLSICTYTLILVDFELFSYFIISATFKTVKNQIVLYFLRLVRNHNYPGHQIVNNNHDASREIYDGIQ